MRFIRYRLGQQAYWGSVELNGQSAPIQRFDRPPWQSDASPTGVVDSLANVTLLAPAEPSKIVAVGRNYADHVQEMESTRAEAPRIFFKPPSSMIGHGEAIQLPPTAVSQEVHYEAELAVIIGKPCRNTNLDAAEAAIFGYTCANDVTARDLQRRDGQPSYAKSFDTFCPLGPWIETKLDLASTPVRCWVNGELKQDGRVAQMLTPVPELLSYIAQAMTLLPGDVVLTGTPAGVGRLRADDEVAVSIDGVGQLVNPVC